MRNRVASLVIFVLAVLLFSSPLRAQVYGPSAQGQRTPESRKAAAAATKPAYVAHDLSGVWWGARNSFDMGVPMPPLTPWGQAQLNSRHPSRGPRAVVPALTDDPLANCDPLGYPRNVYIDTRSFELIPVPGKIVQIFEWAHGSREIYMDGRTIPADADPRWFGWATGKWDGDTLVVDSTGFDERPWFDNFGDPRSEGSHLIERIGHPDSTTLEINMTLDDPKAYTKPWVGGKQTYHMQLPKDATMLKEEYCVPSEEQSFNQNVRNPAGVKAAKTQ